MACKSLNSDYHPEYVDEVPAPLHRGLASGHDLSPADIELVRWSNDHGLRAVSESGIVVFRLRNPLEIPELKTAWQRLECFSGAGHLEPYLSRPLPSTDDWEEPSRPPRDDWQCTGGTVTPGFGFRLLFDENNGLYYLEWLSSFG